MFHNLLNINNLNLIFTHNSIFHSEASPAALECTYPQECLPFHHSNLKAGRRECFSSFHLSRATLKLCQSGHRLFFLQPCTETLGLRGSEISDFFHFQRCRPLGVLIPTQPNSTQLFVKVCREFMDWFLLEHFL